MSSQITDKERQLIDQAIAEGRVQRVVRNKSVKPAPTVDFDEVPRRQPSTKFDRTPARKVYGGAISIEALLQWAFRVECAQLDLPTEDWEEASHGGGFGMEYVMIQRAKLGVKVDGWHVEQVHEDAEVVAGLLANLPDWCGGRRMAIRLSEFARAGIQPDWMPGVVPRLEPREWQNSAYGCKGRAETLEEIKVRIKGRVRPRVVQWVPCMWVPSPAVIAQARADYSDWWVALQETRRMLISSGALRTFELTDAMPPREPGTIKLAKVASNISVL